MLQANEFIQHINPYSKQFIKQKKTRNNIIHIVSTDKAHTNFWIRTMRNCISVAV